MAADPIASKPRIGMQCPKCGTQGLVRVVNLHRKIACKKCGEKFYVAETGRVMTESQAREIRRSALAAAMTPRQREQTSRFFARVPTWVKATCVVAVLLFLMAGAGLLMRGLADDKVPADVESRTRFLAEAVARRFTANVQQLAAGGNESLAAAWAERILPPKWEVNSLTPIQIEVKVLFSDERRCATLATLRADALGNNRDVQLHERSAAAQASNSRQAQGAAFRHQEFSLLMYWVKEEGSWRFDARQSLANSERNFRDEN